MQALTDQINSEWVSFKDLANEVLEIALIAENKRIRLGALLGEVKQALGHGNFGSFISSNLPFSERSARRFMACAAAADHKELKTLDEVRTYHAMLVEWGLREAPVGHGVQTLHPPPNFFISSCKALGNSRKALDELLTHRPLEKMDQDERDQLREQLQPIADIHAKLSHANS